MIGGLSKKINCKLGDKILFLVMGVDGVTSHLAQDLSQIASLSKRKAKIIFIDKDIVTEDDIISGKFLKTDLGKKKAVVTQKRCFSAFSNCEITSISNRDINDRDSLFEILDENIGYTPVIVSRDSFEKNAIIDECINSLYDVLSIRYAVDSERGYCYFKYKFNGEIITNEFTDEEREFIEYFGFTSKIINLEMAKTLFLYIDDFLCENTIRVCGTKVDTITKYATSKSIGKSLCDLKMPEPTENPILFNTKDKILVVLIGTGGTGGSLAYEVSHLISNTENKEFKIMFIDGDTVEEKVRP